MVTEAALPSDGLLRRAEQDETIEASKETAPGKDQEVRWEVVAVARGLEEAAIIRGRLEVEGLLARVQQEPAGVAIGLTVGPLGQAKVLVPEPMVEAALAILNRPAYGTTDENDD